MIPSIPPWLVPIPVPMPATLGEVTVHLIRGPGGNALVDTGMHDAAASQALLAGLAAEGLEPGDVGCVVCTHHHPDHSGLADLFLEAGSRVLMSAADAESHRLFLARPESDAGRATFFGRHAVPPEFEERVSGLFPFFRKLSARFEPTGLVEDGQIVDLGGLAFEVLLTPGHTRGHLCLLRRESGALLTGDHILAAEATHVSMREESIGTDPLGRFLASIERVGKLGAIVGFPGHGRPVADVAERSRELLEHHAARLAEVEAALGDAPAPAFDLSVAVFGPRPKVFARWLAMSQTLGYLEHLVRQGLAEEIETNGKAAYRAAGERRNG
jgi:glyoxylase-like metal-dependent hydrolase (beta-lactamase superfamily II)